MVDFASILNKPLDDIAPPKPFPAGSYLCIVKGLPRFDKSTKKQTDFVEFTLQPIQALDDVDEEELEAFGGLTDKTLRTVYYLTENSIYRLKDFIIHCGVDASGKTPAQAINEIPGSHVIAHVKHRNSEDGERIFAEVSSTASAE